MTADVIYVTFPLIGREITQTESYPGYTKSVEHMANITAIKLQKTNDHAKLRIITKHVENTNQIIYKKKKNCQGIIIVKYDLIDMSSILIILL